MTYRIAFTETEASSLRVAVGQGRAAGLPPPTWTEPLPTYRRQGDSSRSLLNGEGGSTAGFLKPFVRESRLGHCVAGALVASEA